MSTDNKKMASVRKRIVVPKPSKKDYSPLGVSDAELERRLKAVRAAEQAFRRKRQKAKRTDASLREISIYEGISVTELADRMSKSAEDVLNVFLQNGLSVTSQQELDTITAAKIVEEFGNIAVEEPIASDQEAAQDQISASEEEVSISLAIAALQKETTALQNSAIRLAEVANKVISHV